MPHITLAIWARQRIISFTSQSNRVLSAAATMSPFLLSGHESLPPRSVHAKAVTSNKACFSYAAIALVLTAAPCWWHGISRAV